MLSKNFPYRKNLKREAAEARKKEFEKLTPKQVLEQLDKAFGPGVGAMRQRARLARKPAPAQPEPIETVETSEKVEKGNKKTRAKNSAESKKA